MLAPNALSQPKLRHAIAAAKRLADLVSFRYLLLRGSTAAAAFTMGFVQTFVFARVLAPAQFSIFIVVGAIGYTLWLTDLGLAKILFVNLRASHLTGKSNEQAAQQATAVILFYVLLALGAAAVCFTIKAARPSASLLEALQLGLFMLYITLNLAWFSLRSVSISVDLYVFYERLELTRRFVIIAMMLSILVGLPFTGFLIGANCLWGALLATATAKLVRRGAMVARVRGFVPDLLSFFRSHKDSILRSGTSALSGVFVVTSPYYFVPLLYGLGSAPIILEVTMRIFRGGSVIYAAATDLAIPGQTRALAQRDVARMVRTTLFAAGLCCLPALFACAVLIFAGGPFFRFLLKSAATVPPTLVPILIVLMLTNVVQMVSESLLQHTGYFRSLGRVGTVVAALMVTAMALTYIAGLDIVGFLAVYAAVFTTSAILLAIAAVYGPIRAAAAHPGEIAGSSGEDVRELHNVPLAPSAIPVRQGTTHRTLQPTQNP
jgi:O-antigen/teichoic acid export membrane protein